MAQQPTYDEMRAYQAEVRAAINQLERPPHGDVRMQVWTFVDIAASFVAQVIIDLEIVEAADYADDATRLFARLVDGHVRDARGLIP
jgi:hypothetical protein